MISALFNLLFVCLISYSSGVKFPRQNGVTISGDAFRVGEYVSASCNFIKFKQENIHKVEWSINYDQVSTNAFTSFFQNGNKESVPSSYFTVDEHSSGEKVVRIRLNDDREDEITICCKVESVRDSGYGMLKRFNKEKCSSVPVQSERRVQANVTMSVDHDLKRVGEPITFTCEVDQIRDDDLSLAVFINSLQVETKQLKRYQDRRLQSSFTITEDVFYEGQGEKFHMDCVLMQGDYEIARDTTAVKRDRSSAINPSYLQDPVQARKGRVHAGPSSPGDLLDVPYHSYLILEEASTQGTVVKGDLPIDIQDSIRAIRSLDSRFESSEDVVKVLNILGYNGYRVVGMGNNMLNRQTWTLERAFNPTKKP
eukprot:TRINITY_DN4350_c0_g1_i1.p1 TRINITY_DN4350_c0_g1~~TRINITY_DN4350_c0_g1_i1.p1  ORF type:complete len:368 (-),score=49.25 TRINITY_DN4350_c0_g1_i1:373-1476(-)